MQRLFFEDYDREWRWVELGTPRLDEMSIFYEIDSMIEAIRNFPLDSSNCIATIWIELPSLLCVRLYSLSHVQPLSLNAENFDLCVSLPCSPSRTSQTISPWSTAPATVTRIIALSPWISPALSPCQTFKLNLILRISIPRNSPSHSFISSGPLHVPLGEPLTMFMPHLTRNHFAVNVLND